MMFGFLKPNTPRATIYHVVILLLMVVAVVLSWVG